MKIPAGRRPESTPGRSEGTSNVSKGNKAKGAAPAAQEAMMDTKAKIEGLNPAQRIPTAGHRLYTRKAPDPSLVKDVNGVVKGAFKTLRTKFKP